MTLGLTPVRIEIHPIETPRKKPFWMPRNLLGMAALLWLLSGIFLVAPDRQAVLTRFGRVLQPRVFPGIHFHWPYPIESVAKLKVRQLQRLAIGGEVPDDLLGRSQTMRSQFLTGDLNIINVRAIVQYNIADPVSFLFRASNVEQTVGAVVESELNRQLSSRTVDGALTIDKIEIQEIVRQRAQQLLDVYSLGVILSTVSIESIGPPSEAAEAFRSVASARADAGKIINEAHGYSNDIIPRARGEAQQIIETATGYRQRKINQAVGEAARFDALAAEYQKAKAVTRQRLYLEALEAILPRIKKTIVENDSVDLTIIGRGK